MCVGEARGGALRVASRSNSICEPHAFWMEAVLGGCAGVFPVPVPWLSPPLGRGRRPRPETAFFWAKMTLRRVGEAERPIADPQTRWCTCS